MYLMPQTVSAKDIQRNYRKIFNQAKKKSPVVVLTNNQPDVAIIGYQQLKDLYRQVQDAEMKLAIQAIKDYKKEKKAGKLKKLSSLSNLI